MQLLISDLACVIMSSSEQHRYQVITIKIIIFAHSSNTYLLASYTRFVHLKIPTHALNFHHQPHWYQE
jgi:hypothetical protein